MDIRITVLGIFAGFMAGLTGIGGAAILAPLLVMLGVNPAIAARTGLFYHFIAKLFGALQQNGQKTVHFTPVKHSVFGSLPGAFAAGTPRLCHRVCRILCRLNGSQIAGADTAYVLLLVTAAGAMHAGFGHTEAHRAFHLLAGSIPGVLLGSALSAKVPARFLRTITAFLILLGGMKPM